MDCRSRNALDMFAKSISKLERQLQTNSIAQYITPYDGLDPKSCSIWLSDIDKWALVNCLSDIEKKDALVFTARTTVSDFIQRFLKGNKDCA